MRASNASYLTLSRSVAPRSVYSRIMNCVAIQQDIGFLFSAVRMTRLYA